MRGRRLLRTGLTRSRASRRPSPTAWLLALKKRLRDAVSSPPENGGEVEQAALA